MKRNSRRQNTGRLFLLLSVPCLLLGAALVAAWLKPGYIECPGYLEPDSWVPLYAPTDGIVHQGGLTDGLQLSHGEFILAFEDEWPLWNIRRIQTERRALQVEVQSISRRVVLFQEHRDIEAAELHRLVEADRLLEASSSLSISELHHSEFLYRSFLAGAAREEALLLQTLMEAESSLSMLDEDMRLWTRRLDECTLTSPVSGVFYSSDAVFAGGSTAFIPPIGPGRRLEAGRLLGYVIPDGGVKARILIPQRDIGRCRPGQEVLLSLESRPRWKYPPIPGRLNSVSAVASAGGFPAIVQIVAPKKMVEELGGLNCGDLTGRISGTGVNSRRLPARIWEEWAALVNAPFSGNRRSLSGP